MIDDEAPVVAVITQTPGCDHATYNFTDTNKALDHLRDDRDVDVNLCVPIMPDLSGMELYEALVQTLPTLSARVILLTIGGFTQIMLEPVERVPKLHLRQPLNVGELRGPVNERASERFASCARPPLAASMWPAFILCTGRSR